MRRIVVAGLLVLLMASPSAAQTERGRVNTATTDTYLWESDGGQAIITLMWLNGGAELIMALVCGDGVDDPVTFGAAAGELQKFALINVGIPAGLVCAVAITAVRGGSQYFASFLSETDAIANGFGRIGRALPADVSGAHAAALERQLNQLKRLSR